MIRYQQITKTTLGRRWSKANRFDGVVDAQGLGDRTLRDRFFLKRNIPVFNPYCFFSTLNNQVSGDVDFYRELCHQAPLSPPIAHLPGTLKAEQTILNAMLALCDCPPEDLPSAVTCEVKTRIPISHITSFGRSLFLLRRIYEKCPSFSAGMAFSSLKIPLDF